MALGLCLCEYLTCHVAAECLNRVLWVFVSKIYVTDEHLKPWHCIRFHDFRLYAESLNHLIIYFGIDFIVEVVMFALVGRLASGRLFVLLSSSLPLDHDTNSKTIPPTLI